MRILYEAIHNVEIMTIDDIENKLLLAKKKSLNLKWMNVFQILEYLEFDTKSYQFVCVCLCCESIFLGVVLVYFCHSL